MNTISPFVSILMITYNHEAFIAEAIEGVMMQETNFPYQLVIGEDKSTDNTRSLCEEYAAKYPDKIHLLPSEKNWGMMPNFMRTYEACTGKYIALCEGDDYWTDPLKLQKQVDFLEANPDYSICFHNMGIIKNEIVTNDYDDFFNVHIPDTSTINDLAYGNFMHTASVVFKKKLDVLPDFIKTSYLGDFVLHLINANYGKIKKINATMGVYRMHVNGVWSSKNEIEKELKIIDVYQLLKTSNYFDESIVQIFSEKQLNKMAKIISLLEYNSNKEIIDDLFLNRKELIFNSFKKQSLFLSNIGENEDFILKRIKFKLLLKSVILKLVTFFTKK